MVSDYLKSSAVMFGIFGLTLLGGTWYTVPEFRMEVKAKLNRAWNILKGNEYTIPQGYLMPPMKYYTFYSRYI